MWQCVRKNTAQSETRSFLELHFGAEETEHFVLKVTCVALATRIEIAETVC